MNSEQIKLLTKRPIWGQTQDTLTFKKIINGYLTYIKLTLEKNGGEQVVVISFHKDERWYNYEM